MCMFFPRSLSTYAEAKVSIRKIEDFLLLEENDQVQQEQEHSDNNRNNTGLVKIESAQASWLPNSVADTLMNVNLTIPPGILKYLK